MGRLITRDELVAEARSWIGTPFHWQASKKGHGCDCKGLVAGIARELGMPEGDEFAAVVANYRLDFRPAQLLEGLAKTLVRVEEPQPGDVLAIEVDKPGFGPRHLAVLTLNGRMVHCYGKGPIKAVIEIPVGKSRRIDSYWSWPSLGG